jgi:hypothetical protein
MPISLTWPWSKPRTAAATSLPPVLVIAGMHRSGTSMIASACQAAGLWIGDRLIPPTDSNPLGHFEDLDFYDVNRRMLLANAVHEDGLSVPGPMRVPDDLHREAESLVAQRMRRGRAWGWKDPRTTLLLDFWAERIPHAKFLLVFRRPWDVIDSLFRRGDAAIRENPRLALELWCDYNARLYAFAKAHPDRVLVRETDQFIAKPTAVLRAVRRLLGTPLNVHHEVYRRDMFHELPTADYRSVFAACAPDAVSLYHRLRRRAGNPFSFAGRRAAARSRLLDPLLSGWAREAAAAPRWVMVPPADEPHSTSGRAA